MQEEITTLRSEFSEIALDTHSGVLSNHGLPSLCNRLLEDNGIITIRSVLDYLDPTMPKLKIRQMGGKAKDSILLALSKFADEEGPSEELAEGDPTPEEIREWCKILQGQWSPEEKERKRVTKTKFVEVIEYKACDGLPDHVDASCCRVWL